jgi:hypothetical protein
MGLAGLGISRDRWAFAIFFRTPRHGMRSCPNSKQPERKYPLPTLFWRHTRETRPSAIPTSAIPTADSQCRIGRGVCGQRSLLSKATIECREHCLRGQSGSLICAPNRIAKPSASALALHRSSPRSSSPSPLTKTGQAGASGYRHHSAEARPFTHPCADWVHLSGPQIGPRFWHNSAPILGKHPLQLWTMFTVLTETYSNGVKHSRRERLN